MVKKKKKYISDAQLARAIERRIRKKRKVRTKYLTIEAREEYNRLVRQLRLK